MSTFPQNNVHETFFDVSYPLSAMIDFNVFDENTSYHHDFSTYDVSCIVENREILSSILYNYNYSDVDASEDMFFTPSTMSAPVCLSPMTQSDPQCGCSRYSDTRSESQIPRYSIIGNAPSPTSESSSDISDQSAIISSTISHPSATKYNGRRSYKLWEFLRNLLLDERTCPSLIKWDNFSEGTFKFVQSEKVAHLWGQRKKNNRMNYEKLSRAMRYYYRSKVLLPVIGRRLVYQFGPQATGWQTPNPILS